MRPNNFALVCDEFLQHRHVFKNLQPVTLEGYRCLFRLFRNMTGIETLDQFSTKMIEGFLYNGRTQRNWTACTFRGYHKQLRAFCNWAVAKNYISHNYTDGIAKPPKERRLPVYLKPEQCEHILQVAYHQKTYCKVEGVRNRALLAMLIFAGLRLSEVANLKRKDIDFINRTITIRQSKWNKDRQIPMASRLVYFLMEYVEATPNRGKQHIHFFSSVRDDVPLQKRGVQLICRRVKELSGIDFSPQMLRHTFATLTYQGSRDIYAVSGLLGHAKVETDVPLAL